MACTSQSALNYVESARNHLVGELQNLSVILENLYQKGVLSDEEVRNIQAERDGYDKTRKILDSVMKKGEAACYEFLRIIHVTRKRTLGRPTPLSEKNTGASTGSQKFDLHHWISCFSFKEETQMDVDYLQGPKPCHRYQTKLKEKAQKSSNEFWNASKKLFEENRRPDLSYTSLVLDTQKSPSPSKIKKWKRKKSKMSQTEKLRTYIPEDKPEISPTDLLNRQENILLVGKPGIGKTAVVREMLRLWAEKDNKELDYMFYFDMRETSQITPTMSLEDLLFNAFSEPDVGVDEVLQDIKSNSDNVTIIFDGITDLSLSVVQRLVDKELLPDAKIIITCRPDDEEDFFSGDCLRVEVKGFSEQNIKSYLSATLCDAQKVLSSLGLLTLCHVPMYALMVAACSSSEDSPQPCTITEIYIDIVRYCLQIKGNKTKNKDLNTFINTKREEILSLAEIAFHATQGKGKSVNLTEVPCEDSCVLSFLKPLFIKETETRHTFLHYTLQEFFAAVWLLKNPDEIRNVFQQCLTEEMKHMKHLIPFMCRLLNEKSPSWMKCLIPAEELSSTSDWFFKELITTLVPDVVGTEDSGLDVNTLFLCQCLYESQCPEACVYLLDKLDYRLDLCGESLDPYLCCAVAYVVNQSQEQKIRLNLDDVTISEQGMRQLFGCLQNVQWCDPLQQQLWKIFLLGEGEMDLATLLVLDDNQLHLPVEGKEQLFERAVEVMKRMTRKVNVCLYWDRETPVCQSLCESLIEALPSISSLSFKMTNRSPGLWNEEQFRGALERQQRRLLLDLCLKAALHIEQSFPNVVNVLLSLFPNQTDLSNLCLDLYQHVRSEGFLSVIPKLRLLFQSAPAVWSINLSERKTSILLEVLKLQSTKKPVELTGWSDEKSEVRSFLQCLPYISQLSFMPQLSEPLEETRFLGNLVCAAVQREQQTGKKIVELLSVCRYKTFPLKEKWCDFLLDLYCYETKTGLSVLPSSQSAFQSGPAIWSINLSERKTSILLEVLKLQSKKKKVELTGWSHEENEVRSFLQCLPYISQLSVQWELRLDEPTSFFGNLLCAAAEREQQTGEKILEQLSSVCRYKTFPFNDRDDFDIECREVRSDFLLDLFSKVKECETKTGLSFFPSLQSVFQSAPAVWPLNLSKGKTSILLEVLKLQSEKKRVELRDWSDEESEVRSFLQCLPYISQLCIEILDIRLDETTRLFADLFCAAAEREQQTGEKILEQLSSMCSYETFPEIPEDGMDLGDDEECQTDFLLDLFSYVKDYETETGLSVLPSLQSVFQSAPARWFISLSQRKTSILLEVLKLQSEKKPVYLTDQSDEESEVRSLLQCLPYISQLCTERLRLNETTKFFGNVFCAAAEREQQTGEKILEQLSSVCRYETFPFEDTDFDSYLKYQSDFLLDLFSHLKDCETKTGLTVLPSLQSVFQSAPAGWSIKLLERKTSILLEVLKLQSEKKPVYLTGWSDEESEVRNFLQCLPYVSQLRVQKTLPLDGTTRLFVNLFCAAAEREQQTGEKILELLSSVCRYEDFPLKYRDDDDKEFQYQSDFLLDLFSHVKDYETKTGLSVLPSLQSVFQSAPAGWSIKLSERKTSILLEVLKLQSEKKPVYLPDPSHEESEMRSFLQCLPYISQLRVLPWLGLDEKIRFFRSLFCAAAEREQQTGEKILELLSSVCSYETGLFNDRNDKNQSAFLLDLFSHLKDYETETGLSVLPSLKSVFQAGPAVWFIDFSERKTSILLEVLKLQSEKKPARLTGWSHEESERRGFLQCLPYISELSCGPDFFQSVCSSISVRSKQEVQQLVSLLQLLDFKLLLTGKLSRRTCCSVGRVLQLCGSRVDLSLTAKKMSVRRTSLLFRRPTQLHSLRLSNAMVLLLFQWVRRSRLMCPLTVEELCLVTEENQASERALLKVVSSLCSLLRSCSVRQLVLTESCIPAQCLIPLLLLHGPPPIKLSEDHVEQLLVLVHEVQDQDLTLSLLSAVDGDLTSCSLNWELLHYLLQQSPAQTITVDLRMNLFLQESAARLLPFLGRIVIKRPSPSLVMTSIRELYRAHTSHMVPSLLRSLDHVINLSNRELDSVDSAALLFTLRHSDRVKLNLRWTSIPAEGTRSILSMLDRVSELSVDRNQLLRFIHCCAASDAQQEAASGLLRTLQQRLDLSCQSCVDLQEEDETEPLSLTADDCRAASMVLKHCNPDTQLHLQDCEVEDGGLDLLFSVLDRVRLRVSKSVLLQLLSLLPVHSERDTVRRAESLCGALGGQLDLSNSTLNQRVCGDLIQMLDSCEGLTELNLSDCQLSDQLLLPLITHLHKVQVLDLRYNQITDASTDVLLQLISIHSSIHTVRLFSNYIVYRRPFKKHKQFEMW
ncbi:uncharacterized protein LOC110968810 isoform X2 [Acanthochromis polyacanthus]|uniref:uncharacterized protein LOC110968810 isoform X2 n=1 Tax=Acanthochromis polyacanthus TaxID=80966 RepID=UPI0022347489|nr:uncharacterized protein LOC110968810 isoform X2 [Acanthochromis polyacanthus]XP_051797582.1 uncharacterized protein LOC110968810 isoform X2 [Acanthochromis polyacanthus]